MSEQNLEGARRPRNVLAPLSGRASHGRSVEQRLFVRFPPVYRLLAAAFMRLPPGSRLRRSLVARSVGQAYAASELAIHAMKMRPKYRRLLPEG